MTRLTDERISDLWSWSMTAEAEKTATTQQHAFARAIETELSTQEPVAYRCFHCREEFTDDATAELHFGRSELDKPACQISIEHVRWLEQQHHRGVQDDTEALRTIRGMLSEHETLRRRAEEEGYAKGLADARKHPEDIGLTAAPPLPSAPDTVQVPPGWALVPVEPTDAMVDATYHGQPIADIWADMIAAAPKSTP